jgi:serine/threonine protein kinase
MEQQDAFANVRGVNTPQIHHQHRDHARGLVRSDTGEGLIEAIGAVNIHTNKGGENLRSPVACRTPDSVDRTQAALRDQYRLLRPIGSGSFGDVFLGEVRATGEQVAVKLEKKETRPAMLAFEYDIYRELQGGCKCTRRICKHNLEGGRLMQ